MKSEQTAIQNLLLERYSQMRAKNASFSIRAFSKKLGLTSGTVSLLMLGKRRASKKLAAKIAEKLLLDPIERQTLLSQFPLKRVLGSTGETLQYLQLTADQFQIAAEWHYFGILNLLHLKSFKNDSKWIAKRLGISVTKAEDALDRLKRLGLLIEENGDIRRSATNIKTTDDVQNISLKRSHYQTLELARESLDRDPMENRDFTWLTLPMDLKKMKDAKGLIRKFQDDLIHLMGTNSEPNEVYRLAVQLFPLTKSDSGENE